MLATRCDGVLAVDSAGAAVSAARRRNGGARNVRVEQMQVPAEWPSSSFDLIVVSELGYYLNESALGELLDNGERCTTAGAHLVAVHWRGHASDFALAGGASAVRRKIVEASAWRPIVSLCDEFFLLDVVERR
jgi:hypothetical protein